MTEKPILFSTSMVRAILEGKKTMTRRVIQIPESWRIKPFSHYEIINGIGGVGICFDQSGLADWKTLASPYQIGDHLWVKESYCVGFPATKNGYGIIPDKNGSKIVYKASSDYGDDPPPWKSGRFMFKKYARLWLEVTAVKAERLQDISDEDIKKEGCPQIELATGLRLQWFKTLWDSINGKKYPWKNNDWVFAYEYKRIK